MDAEIIKWVWSSLVLCPGIHGRVNDQVKRRQKDAIEEEQPVGKCCGCPGAVQDDTGETEFRLREIRQARPKSEI